MGDELTSLTSAHAEALMQASNTATGHMVGGKIDINQASRALKAMGHPLRLKIMCILAAKKELSVQDLVERVGTTQSNISQHLSMLRDKDVLVSRRDANKVYYSIGDRNIMKLMETLRIAFCSTN